ncbi:unnamed protein product [Rhodiola kirilowii]
MGEIYIKSIESVQAALCYFGEKNEPKKLRSPSTDLDLDSHKNMDELQKELANYKVQLEAKGSENLQALLNLQHYRTTVRELSAKLEECEAERDAYMDCLTKSKGQKQKLEIEINKMVCQLSEALKIKEQLSDVCVKLQAAQTELISMRHQTQTIQDLEHQLLSKSLFIDSLQSEVQDARELSSFSEDAAAEALETTDLLRTKLEAERKNSKQLLYIESLDMELGLVRMELKNAKEDSELLNRQVEKLSDNVECAKQELNEINKGENELQIEIAVLKSDLHKARSETAAAAASEARGNNVRSGLCLAVKQLAIEAEEAKRQTLKLKQGDFCVTKSSPEDENFTFQSVGGSESDNVVTISLEEYQSLLAKAEKQSTILAIEVNNELEVLKKEHEAAVIKVNEFRTRAEQAVTRAESAERAKVAVKGQLRKWREQKQRRKAAKAALKEETLHSQSYHQAIYDDDDKPVGKYQPLGKVLNMKF